MDAVMAELQYLLFLNVIQTKHSYSVLSALQTPPGIRNVNWDLNSSDVTNNKGTYWRIGEQFC